MWRLFISDKAAGSIKQLYPKQEHELRIKAYIREKVKLCGLILAAGLLVIVLDYRAGDSVITDDGKIKRSDYLKGDKTYELEYEISDVGLSGDMDVSVSEKQYSESTVKKMWAEFSGALEGIIPGDNESLDYVTEDLNFVKEIPGYPFRVSYRTDNPLVLSSAGVINRDKVSDDGNAVSVTATVSYRDYEEIMTFGVMVYKKPLTVEESAESLLRELVEARDAAGSTEDFIKLPESVSGHRVVFREKDDGNGPLAAVIVILLAVAVCIGKDKDLEKEADVRNKELKSAYPGLVNRFTLFYTAGMPIKNIWMKICGDYERQKAQTGEKNYLYEEMLVVRAMINDGAAEAYAYDEFGMRMGLSEYKSFVSLINQAISKGSGNLAAVLRRETEDAFNERINNARKLTEEAGTKLLMPMFMMLMVVIVIVMYPAFVSF